MVICPLSRYVRACSPTSKDLNTIHERFLFVVRKTRRSFSSIALDHAHEQVNAIVKGDGGAVRLTENPAALRRWMVAGPEVTRMEEEFECNVSNSDSQNHHEQTPNVQSAFAKDVLNLIASFEELRNPFMELGEKLIAIHTEDIMSNDVVNTVRNVKKIGNEQFQTFVKEQFIDRSTLITEPLKKNKLPTFSTPNTKVMSKTRAKVAVLKQDCALFSRLYIACQSRDGNLLDFFRFENQPWPISLSQGGNLRGGGGGSNIGGGGSNIDGHMDGYKTHAKLVIYF